MKAIIDRRKYDTETAEEVATDSYSNPRDFAYWEETLYKKKNGEFFLYGEGGPASRYRESCGVNEWSGGAKIVPLSLGEAVEWAEKHMDPDDMESAFGEFSEDGTQIVSTVVTVRNIGGCLGFHMTKELRTAGIDVGDQVRIYIQKL